MYKVCLSVVNINSKYESESESEYEYEYELLYSYHSWSTNSFSFSINQAWFEFCLENKFRKIIFSNNKMNWVILLVVYKDLLEASRGMLLSWNGIFISGG